MISFAVSDSDAKLIERIAWRAAGLAANRPAVFARSSLDYQMDITATHVNGCPLDLQRMLDADDFNFAHDVFGIERHLDRSTGQLLDCFLPRFARRCQDSVPSDPAAVRNAHAAKRAQFEERKAHHD